MARASLQGVIMQANGPAGGSATVTAATYATNFKQISDMFKSILTQTTDTGQVNFATLSTLPAVGAVRDYEIYQLNDAFTATSPVYLRIDYSFTGAASTPVTFGFTFGTATDGAGNITALTVPKLQTSIASTAFYAYLSTDGSQITFITNMNPFGTAADSGIFGFALERFRNADGTPNGEGFNVWQFLTGQFYYNYSRVVGMTTQPALDLTPPLMVPGIGNTTSFFTAGTEYAFPFSTWGPTWRGASQAVMYGLAADFPRDTPVNVTHYGKTAQFFSLGSSLNLSMPYFNGISTVAMKTGFTALLRWE